MLRALSALVSLSAAVAIAQTAPQRLAAVRLNAGVHNINAEVARTPAERATGLMFRNEMGANEGMLFVFEQAGVQCFWMRNTLLPLSIAFLSDAGKVINVADMQPGSVASHCSVQPVRYALEMNQGWFAKRGIKPGAAISGAPFEAARR